MEGHEISAVQSFWIPGLGPTRWFPIGIFTRRSSTACSSRRIDTVSYPRVQLVRITPTVMANGKHPDSIKPALAKFRFIHVASTFGHDNRVSR